MKSSLWLLPIGAASLLLAAYTHHHLRQAQIEGRAAHEEYTITDLGTLGGGSSTVTGLNAHGQVVGSSETGVQRQGQARDVHAFLYSGGRMQDLETLGGHHGEATAINDAGVIIGYTDGAALKNGSRPNVLFSNGKTEILKPLEDGAFVTVTAINNAGRITGYHSDRDKPGVRSFICSSGSLEDLDSPAGADDRAKAINDKGEVVGAFRTKKGYFHAFVYTGGIMRDLGTLGGWESYADAINDKGQVVGGADLEGSTEKEFWNFTSSAIMVRSESTRLHAFIYSDGKMQDLGPLGDGPVPTPEYASRAYGINSSGQVVGSTTEGEFRPSYSCAFLYTNGRMVDLNTRVNLAHTGFELLYSARAINDAGQIVGEGTITGGGTHAFLLTPIARQ